MFTKIVYSLEIIVWNREEKQVGFPDRKVTDKF